MYRMNNNIKNNYFTKFQWLVVDLFEFGSFVTDVQLLPNYTVFAILG